MRGKFRDKCVTVGDPFCVGGKAWIGLQLWTIESTTELLPKPFMRNTDIEVAVSSGERLVWNEIRARAAHRRGRLSSGEVFGKARRARNQRGLKLRSFDHHAAPGLLAHVQGDEHRFKVDHRTVPIELG